MAYQWLYNTPISGLQFPMVTASGPYAAGFAPTSISAEISKDGGAWASLSGRISSIPGNGVYTIANLTAAEMQCYTWFIKLAVNSGALEQGLAGINISAHTAILAAQVHTSAQIPVVTEVRNVSGGVQLNNNVHASAEIAVVTQVRNAMSGNAGTANVDISSIALQVWNTLRNTAASGPTFGGYVNASGIQGVILAPQVHTSAVIPIVTEVRNISGKVSLNAGVHASAIIPEVTQVLNLSGTVMLAGVNHAGAIIPVVTTVNNISGGVQLNNGVHASAQIAIVTEVRNVSGNVVLAGITHAGAVIPLVTQVNNLSGTVVIVANNDKTGYGINISSVNAIRDIATTDAASLTSGTIANDLRMLRWFTFENWTIDKTTTPDRLYLWNGANMSSLYYNLTDDAAETKRTRG